MFQRIIIQPSSNATAVDIDLLIASSSISSSNQFPIANAGSNIFITAPSSSVELNGSNSSDPDGNIVLYLWTKVSGPAVTIVNSTNSITQATGLVQGTYVFRLTVTDNSGTMSSDTISVTVNAPVDVEPPSSPALSGVASSNSISLTWTQAIDNVGIAGYDVFVNNVLRTSVNEFQTSYVVISLLPSTLYNIYVKAKDVNGNTANSNTLSIATTEAPNQPPTVNAGTDKTITLPTSTVNLTGVANDPDGIIASYFWSKVSGGSATITTPSSNTTSITGLAKGNYIFRLTATDNKGVSVSDDVSVTVNPELVISGIQGYGSQAIGGTNSSTVYHVTNLASSGPGSLNGGIGSNKTIVFDVAGVIKAGHNVTNVSYLTIDGTTAPFPGVTITNASGDGMSLNGSSDHIIVQGLAFVDCNGDGLNAVENANNYAFLNCVAYGNTDGNIDLADDSDYGTMAWCIEGWNKGFSQGNSGGTLATGNRISYHHNFTNYGVNNSGQDGERSPFGHRNYGVAAPGNEPDCDVRNNLIYNYGRDNATGTGFGSGFGYNYKANVVNNYYFSKSTAAAADGVKLNVDNTTSQVYSAGNVSGNGFNFNSGTRYTNHAEWSIPPQYRISVELACASATRILQEAGLKQRDVNGNRVAAEQTLLAGVVLTGCSVQPPTNQGPVVNAGTDKTITWPTSSVTLNGSAVDPDGIIASYLWSKVSGPVAGTISSTTTPVTDLNNLSTGSYVFNLRATDNSGSVGNDTVTVNVITSIPTQPTGSYDGYTLVYSTGYNIQNDLDPFGHGQIGNGSLSTTIFKTGPGSFKSVPANVSSGIRSEVQYGSGQTPLEGIVEYDVYYDNFFANSGHSLQWHPTTSGGSGTGLYHKNGQLQFVTVKSGTSGTNVGSPFSVSTKAWHHIKLTYKFGSSGYIKVEFDGVEKVNANVQMGDGSAPYLKVGVNMWADQTSVVYYDNLQVYKKI